MSSPGMTKLEQRLARQRRGASVTMGVVLGGCVGIYYFTIWSMQGRSLDTVDLNEYRKPSDEDLPNKPVQVSGIPDVLPGSGQTKYR